MIIVYKHCGGPGEPEAAAFIPSACQHVVNPQWACIDAGLVALLVSNQAQFFLRQQPTKGPTPSSLEDAQLFPQH